jgi:transposase-like protein
MNVRKRWTPEELEILKAGLQNKESLDKIAEKLGRKEGQVRLKTYFLSDNKDRFWGEKEEEYLKENITKTDKEIASDLVKSVGTVAYQRNKLKIYKTWTVHFI